MFLVTKTSGAERGSWYFLSEGPAWLPLKGRINPFFLPLRTTSPSSSVSTISDCPSCSSKKKTSPRKKRVFFLLVCECAMCGGGWNGKAEDWTRGWKKKQRKERRKRSFILYKSVECHFSSALRFVGPAKTHSDSHVKSFFTLKNYIEWACVCVCVWVGVWNTHILSHIPILSYIGRSVPPKERWMNIRASLFSPSGNKQSAALLTTTYISLQQCRC